MSRICTFPDMSNLVPLLQIWSYDAGTVEAIGLGHSGNITKCVFSPDGAFVVSVGDEGSVYIWKVEEQDDLE